MFKIEVARSANLEAHIQNIVTVISSGGDLERELRPNFLHDPKVIAVCHLTSVSITESVI